MIRRISILGTWKIVKVFVHISQGNVHLTLRRNIGKGFFFLPGGTSGWEEKYNQRYPTTAILQLFHIKTVRTAPNTKFITETA